MPIAKGKYVRYWDGHAVAYGVIVEVRDTTYRIRVGGTDTVVEVPYGQVALHTAIVASGAGLDPAKYRRVQVENIYLYHATSCDLLPSITTMQGLVPRSRINWVALGPDVWSGAEKASGRDALVVSERDYFADLQASALKGPIRDQTLLGDVGEFFYAAPRHDDVFPNYVNMIFNAGKSPVAVRFKTPSMAWYEDPKAKAVMTMNVIPLRVLEMKYIPRRLKGIAAEDDLIRFIGDDEGWIRCSEEGWRDELLLQQLMDL